MGEPKIVTDIKLRHVDGGILEMEATIDGVKARYTSSDGAENWSLAPPWYPLLIAVEPRWHDSPEVGHAAALAFLASVYDGDEPMRWRVCIDDSCVLRVDWHDALHEDALSPGAGTPIVARRANGQILVGHTRFKAALKLGLEQVPVRFIPNRLVGPVRDVAVVPLLSNIPSMTVWGDSADVPLYEWKPACGPQETR